MRTKRIDIIEEAREILETEIPEIEEAQAGIVKAIEAKYESWAEVPVEYEDRFNRLEDRRVDLQGTAYALVEAVMEWAGAEPEVVVETYGSVQAYIEREGWEDIGDGVFVARSLTMGALAEIQDEISEASFEFDAEAGEISGGMPKTGYATVATLRKAIIEQPDGGPTRYDDRRQKLPEPADYPYQVGGYLFDIVNNFNTVGDTDLGNSSLREMVKM